jgi:hypothetical protein
VKKTTGPPAVKPGPRRAAWRGIPRPDGEYHERVIVGRFRDGGLIGVDCSCRRTTPILAGSGEGGSPNRRQLDPDGRAGHRPCRRRPHDRQEGTRARSGAAPLARRYGPSRDPNRKKAVRARRLPPARAARRTTPRPYRRSRPHLAAEA